MPKIELLDGDTEYIYIYMYMQLMFPKKML